MKGTSRFDYIILGAGCAGLSLAVRMIESKFFDDKKILLIDKAPKHGNDKTWCFWDKGNIAPYWNKAGIIHHTWDKLWIKKQDDEILLDSKPYNYSMIRSNDFYHYCFSKIKKAPNINVHYAAVSHFDTKAGTVHTNDEIFLSPIIFSSVLMTQPELQADQVYLLQHFLGWWIETEEDAFDPDAADLMNFSTSQHRGCSFLYVLPVSPRRALIEYTLFSEEPLKEEEYEKGLRAFISNELKIDSYKIAEKEKGIIPMTDYRFPQQDNRVIFIGTAGGQTKPSSGYTFSFIQKQSEEIVRLAETNKLYQLKETPSRFRFYDSVLLKVLQERRISGAEIFFNLFKKNKAKHLFRFLDNESNILEELRIMNAVKKSVFVPTALKIIRRKTT